MSVLIGTAVMDAGMLSTGHPSYYAEHSLHSNDVIIHA